MTALTPESLAQIKERAERCESSLSVGSEWLTLAVSSASDVPALLAHIEELQAHIDKALAIHQPETWEDDRSDGYGTSGVGCSGCACPDCGNVEAHGPYPCPTIAALTPTNPNGDN